jgi:hypothetical protein
MSLSYTAINGMPLTRHYRPFVGWYGDMDLPPHFWELLKLGRLTATIEFHEPISTKEMKSRKKMSARCQAVISDSVERTRVRDEAA